ncbi:two-component sensor histidine kinase [Alteromonadales bacterium alter-6D02]|nr:two-component sensor histidine kinase [Alteromonadales bacterium alter-6D02]
MKRTPSISFTLARFVFICCVALALTITIAVATVVVSTMKQGNEQILNREMTSIVSRYQIFIQHRLTLLQQLAREPLMIQSLMQPEVNIGKIKDHMNTLPLLGKPYELTLLDFEGRIIHANKATTSVEYHTFDWVLGLLEQSGTDFQVIEIDGQAYWSLGVSITYNQSVEGVLIANIPLQDINEQGVSVQPLTGLSIEIVQNNKVLTKFGTLGQGSEYVLTWPSQRLMFRFTVDEHYKKQEVESIVTQLVLIITTAILVVTLFAYLFGYRYFVQPVVLLSNAAKGLENGEEQRVLDEGLKVREFNELFQTFNLMTKRVIEREQALKESYLALSKTNESLKDSESQLIQSEKMASIGVLAAGVAHEINNPIGFVKSNLEVLHDYVTSLLTYHRGVNELLALAPELAPEQKRLADTLDIDHILDDMLPLLDSSSGGIKRVSEIVDSLRTFARVEQDEMSLIDINEGLTATLNMVSNELKYCCDVKVSLSPVPMVMGFPGKLNQVFMNVLVNAGQAMTHHGEVRVKTYFTSEDVVIEIADDGCGIEAEKLSQIFTPFYTSKPVGQGTGLGLSISHQIMEQHNGSITVASVIGQGTCFTIKVPTHSGDKS